MPDEFYQSIRHVSSFANIELYRKYEEKEIIKWNMKDVIIKDITVNG